MPNQLWQRFAIWDNWSRVTRFLNTAQMAFDAEYDRWDGNYTIKDQTKVTLERIQNDKKFSIDLPIYLDVLKDQHLLCAVILQYSYGLVEQHAKDVLEELYNRNKLIPSQLDITGNNSDIHKLIDDFTSKNKSIEVWGTKVIHFTNRRWSDVTGGLKGLVEVAIIRNAIAHGKPVITNQMVNRANNHHFHLPWNLGEEVRLNIQTLEEYRSRLRSFSRVIATGAVA